MRTTGQAAKSGDHRALVAPLFVLSYVVMRLTGLR